MLTPNEIQNKSFKTSAVGYKKDEVDEFISIVYGEFDNLYKQNIALNDKINMLSEAVKQYKSMEAALQNTIVTAQNVSEELKRTAQLTAEATLRDAEQQAEKMINDANKKVSEIKARYDAVRQEFDIYKTKIKTVVEAQLRTIDELE